MYILSVCQGSPSDFGVVESASASAASFVALPEHSERNNISNPTISTPEHAAHIRRSKHSAWAPCQYTLMISR